MAFIDKWNSKIQSSDLNLLEKGYAQLCGAEVELENQLKDIQEAKARFMVEIDLRINGNKKK